MALTLRGLKGSALTHAELDNNFIFLKSRDIVNASLIGCNLTFTKDDGSNFSVNLSGCTGGGSISGDTYITTGYTQNNILYLFRNDATTIEIPLNIEVSGITSINETVFYFTASTSQTYFNSILPSSPIDVTKTKLFVNGVKYKYGSGYDYLITGGTSVIWSGPFNLDTLDDLSIVYFE